LTRKILSPKNFKHLQTIVRITNFSPEKSWTFEEASRQVPENHSASASVGPWNRPWAAVQVLFSFLAGKQSTSCRFSPKDPLRLFILPLPIGRDL
jgi:hypothetical protein